MRTFLISDTHFGHHNIIKFTSRPFRTLQEMEDIIVGNWNRLVKNQDLVYHMGDVASAPKHLKILDKLNGRKILIKGNHDTFKLREYVPYFDDILACKELNNFIVTHFPLQEAGKMRYQGNLHGHIHDNEIEDKWYMNLCVEKTCYAPVRLDRVFELFDERLS